MDMTNLSVGAFLSMVQLMDLAGGFCGWKLLIPITHKQNSHFLRQNSFTIGCPVELITDLDTENGLAAAMQSFFRYNPEAHRYVFSQGIRELRAGGHSGAPRARGRSPIAK